MSREQDAARARGEAAKAASLLASVEAGVREALAECDDADAKRGYQALLDAARPLRAAVEDNAADLARENGFTYPRGERAARNLDAVHALVRRVNAYDPDEFADAARRERDEAAATESARVAALAVADERLIAARARCDELRTQLEGINYALASSTIEETLAMGDGAAAHYDGLRADATRLDAELDTAHGAAKAARTARDAAYRVVSFEAARASDLRLRAAANEQAQIARRNYCETESF